MALPLLVQVSQQAVDPLVRHVSVNECLGQAGRDGARFAAQVQGKRERARPDGIEAHPRAEAAALVTRSLDDETAVGEALSHERPRWCDVGFGVLPEHVECPDQVRAMTGQLEASALEAQMLGGPASRRLHSLLVDLQADHGRRGVDGAKLRAERNGRDRNFAEAEVDRQQVRCPDQSGAGLDEPAVHAS